jgi:hypothetical protein
LGYGFWAAEFLLELWQSVQARNLWFLFFSLIYFFLMLILYRWLEARVESAPMNPKIHWFEGHPKSLPRLSAQVRLQPDAEWIRARVRRIDSQGVFLLLEEATKKTEIKPGRVIEFCLEHPSRQAKGVGELVSALDHENRDSGQDRGRMVKSNSVIGIGLLFLPKDLYHLTEYSALYQDARGEGYVF